MTAPRKTMTDEEAAILFTTSLLERVREAWPSMYKQLRAKYGKDFHVDNEVMAGFDLFLAALALDTRALKNLFLAEEALSLYRWVLRLIKSPEFGDYGVGEVTEYVSSFERTIEGPDPRDAQSVIPARLLHRWLGPRIKSFEMEANGKKTGFLDPLLVADVTGLLLTFVGTWKSIAADYQIRKGDLPPDYDPEDIGGTGLR